MAFTAGNGGIDCCTMGSDAGTDGRFGRGFDGECAVGVLEVQEKCLGPLREGVARHAATNDPAFGWGVIDPSPHIRWKVGPHGGNDRFAKKGSLAVVS